MYRRVQPAASLWCLLLLLAAGLVAQGELVIVKEGTGLYHRPGCEVIRDATDVLAMTVGQAEARGYKAHPDCDPFRPKPPAAVPAPEAAGKPARRPAPIYVFVDAGGTLYHRETCRRLGKAPKKIVLDRAAAKKYWPCGICRPPILPRVKK